MRKKPILPYHYLFWRKVTQGQDGCWLWTGHVTKSGYGRLGRKNKRLYAHRVAWEEIYGPIPASLTIDHLCRNTLCVNPAHLEPVTQKENNARGLGGHRKVMCPHGHPYNETNTYFRKRGGRDCRLCHNAQEARRRANRE